METLIATPDPEDSSLPEETLTHQYLNSKINSAEARAVIYSAVAGLISTILAASFALIGHSVK